MHNRVFSKHLEISRIVILLDIAQKAICPYNGLKITRKNDSLTIKSLKQQRKKKQG